MTTAIVAAMIDEYRNRDATADETGREIIDQCADLGMWKAGDEPCFGKTRAWALERASDLMMQGEDALLHDGTPDPRHMQLALAWIAYAQACKEAAS